MVVLGCGRSGTSIFGELFEALPGYRYWSEPALHDLVSEAGLATAIKVPIGEPGDDPPIGLSVSLPRLHAAVSEPRVLFWMVRHPLDAVCSLRVGIEAGWAHHPRPPDWERWLDRPLVERCAHHWATINGPGYGAVEGEAVVQRFEGMIADPRGCADRVAQMVDADPAGDDVAAWVARVRDANDEHFIEARTSRRHSRPDHHRRVGRWRENLTAEEVAAVRPIVAPAAATFGYELG